MHTFANGHRFFLINANTLRHTHTHPYSLFADCCVCIFAQGSNKLFPQNLILLFPVLVWITCFSWMKLLFARWLTVRCAHLFSSLPVLFAVYFRPCGWNERDRTSESFTVGNDVDETFQMIAILIIMYTESAICLLIQDWTFNWFLFSVEKIVYVVSTLLGKPVKICVCV